MLKFLFRSLTIVVMGGMFSCQNPISSPTVSQNVGSRDVISGTVNDFIEFNYDFKNDGVIDLPGRLFVPYTYDANSTDGYGLILFFHGAGETGSDNQVQVQRNITNLANWAKANNYFLYAPQLPASKNASWSATFVDYAVRQIANVERLYNIAPGKIYASGLSLGGGGVYLSMIRYPGAFAAGTSSCGVDPAGSPSLAPLYGQAIWSFHASDDGTVNVSKFYNRMNAIRALYGLGPDTFPPTYDSNGEYNFPDSTVVNPAFRYTNYQTGGHNIWGRVFSRSEMYQWWKDNAKSVTTTSLQSGEKFLVDFGSIVPAADATTDVWNISLANYQKTIGAVLPFGKTSLGRGTSISVDVDTAFEKTFTTSLSGPYPVGIGTDGWQTYANGTSTLRIRGLVPGAGYRLRLFATTTLAHKNTSYTVSSIATPVVFNPTNNVDQFATFDAVTADAKGSITISVAGDVATASTVGILNALELSVGTP